MTPVRGDVVVAQFLFVEQGRLRRRPTLVVSDGVVGGGRVLWVLMITGSSLALWPHDVRFETGFTQGGLKRASVIRVEKIAAVSPNSAEVIGRAPRSVMAAVDDSLRRLLALG